MNQQRPSSETPAWRSGDRLELSGRSSRRQSKTAQKRPFLDTKSAVEPARRLETQRNVFVVMRLGSPVVLSYLDARFEPRCGRKDFLCACCCCCCCLLKRVAQPWPLKGGVKPRQGTPSSVITYIHILYHHTIPDTYRASDNLLVHCNFITTRLAWFNHKQLWNIVEGVPPTSNQGITIEVHYHLWIVWIVTFGPSPH